MENNLLNMKVSLQQIYDKALYARDLAIESGIEDYMLEAIILAGIYYGYGGRKKIPIGLNYIMISTTVAALTKAKRKFGHDVNRNITILNKYLEENTDRAVSISRIPTFNDRQVALRIMRNDNGMKYSIVLPQNKITDDALYRIAQVILGLYSNIGVDTPEKQIKFRDCFLLYMRYVE